MSNWFALIIGGLATYRMALLVSKESGPAFIFRKLRRLPSPKSSAKEWLSCIYCVSIWIAAATTTYEWWIGLIPANQIVLYWLAMSSLAIFANQQWTKTEK